MTISEFVDVITQGGVIGLLVLIVVGGWRRWYVWAWAYHELLQDRDEWKSLAMRGTGLAETATDAVAKKANDA